MSTRTTLFGIDRKGKNGTRTKGVIGEGTEKTPRRDVSDQNFLQGKEAAGEEPGTEGLADS
jgi:hypothetical protein